MRLDKSGSYHTGVSQHLKVSFEIAFMIAKQKIPNNIDFRRRCRAKNEVYFSFEHHSQA
ncbi:unnamed protein product [Acanthoscelides obtectus]|uniref:Uncharacterized protein n=1 Tax=Acanthoscelides obtectus TaxID=200917 RepID=A0A9P0Q6F0_ACAOB|nr:unnamed protein product [Acanthoscelides obtectus]CAK1639293.1 hypothetical protein AOBTE_LOCUS11106 [Acanthoscelides obtectus]